MQRLPFSRGELRLITENLYLLYPFFSTSASSGDGFSHELTSSNDYGLAIKGPIGTLGLEDWFTTALDDEEQGFLTVAYARLANRDVLVTEDSVDIYAQRSVRQGRMGWRFGGLAHTFRDPEYRHIARRIIQKGEQVCISDVLDLHFVYAWMIDIYYRDRDTTPTGLAETISACQKQIDISDAAKEAFLSAPPTHPYDYLWKDPELPHHLGYRRLCIIREKQREYEEAIRLATQALDQGWNDNWQKRIDRCQKRLKK